MSAPRTLTLLVLSVIGAELVSGCTRDDSGAVVFEEAAGGVVADLLTKLSGTEDISAVTLPDGTVVYFRNANDPGVRCHEASHVQQIQREGGDWIWRYLGQHVSKTYKLNPYEIEARQAAELCAGATP